jgi:hypothetical protein
MEAIVRERLRNAPLWVVSLTMSVFVGTWMTVFGYLEHGNWTRAIFSGLITGVLFGATMGPTLARKRARAMAATDNMSARDLRVAGRAVRGGPVPLDPKIRQAAEWLATNELNELTRFRWVGLILFLFLTVSSVLFALTSPWWWLSAAAILFFFAFCLLRPSHLKRRIEILKLGASG